LSLLQTERAGHAYGHASRLAATQIAHQRPTGRRVYTQRSVRTRHNALLAALATGTIQLQYPIGSLGQRLRGTGSHARRIDAEKADHRSINPFRIALFNPQPRQGRAKCFFMNIRTGYFTRPAPRATGLVSD